MKPPVIITIYVCTSMLGKWHNLAAPLGMAYLASVFNDNHMLPLLTCGSKTIMF